MATATVTPTMRTAGWNIEFLTHPTEIPFAGIFQPSHDVFLTFRDIIDEMRLAFEIADVEADMWDEVAFGLVGIVNMDEEEPAPRSARGTSLEQLLPAMPEHDGPPDERPVLQYQVFRHSNCTLPANQPSEQHFKAGCATSILKPTRRPNASYLPPKKPSSDPRFSAFPLRKRRAGSTSPKKRPASGSMSPRKNGDDPDEDASAMVAPLECYISEATAKAAMANFRQNCFTLAKTCAVSGLGRSWCELPPFGPALQACHIVEQMHYHVYPDEEEVGDSGASARRLEAAWKRTWAPENGILLLSHLHECFDMRLFSIHPQTLKVRVFMPYDVLLAYHGVTAKIPRNTDRRALRHHYDMCCIENIAARMPWPEEGGWTSGVSTSGVLTPLDVMQLKKRKRDDGWANGYLTPENCEAFLADVNWELSKVVRRVGI